MQTWYFSENPYPYVPDVGYDSVRVSLPNEIYDPEIGADLYARYFDEWQAADELGLNVMCNEHHQTATCLQPAVPISSGILARITKNARILVLGNPLPNRRDPVRIAEEMAVIDNISRGRLEVGFVRSVPFEVLPANSSPVGMSDRLWESHDLILKAWTTHDGPFNWEGSWHYRAVNIWPRPYQQPHPPIWMTGSSLGSVPAVAKKGYVFGTFVGGYEHTGMLFREYRKHYEGGDATDRLAYNGLLFVADSDEKAREGLAKMQWYFDGNKVPRHFAAPIGYQPPRGVLAQLRNTGQKIGGVAAKGKSVDWLVENGLAFAGTPDTVFKQIEKFYNSVGGFGHFLAMGHAGALDHDSTIHSTELYAREVVPRLEELTVPDNAITSAGMA